MLQNVLKDAQVHMKLTTDVDNIQFIFSLKFCINCHLKINPC